MWEHPDNPSSGYKCWVGASWSAAANRLLEPLRDPDAAPAAQLRLISCSMKGGTCIKVISAGGSRPVTPLEMNFSADQNVPITNTVQAATEGVVLWLLGKSLPISWQAKAPISTIIRTPIWFRRPQLQSPARPAFARNSGRPIWTVPVYFPQVKSWFTYNVTPGKQTLWE